VAEAEAEAEVEVEAEYRGVGVLLGAWVDKWEDKIKENLSLFVFVPFHVILHVTRDEWM